jgi:hypothetical protein
MASIAFNFTAAQSARIQSASQAYNSLAGTTLTPKQWLLLIIKEAVLAQLDSTDIQTVAAQAANTARAAIEADLVGSA